MQSTAQGDKLPLWTNAILTLGGDPLDSSIATPKTDVRAPNQVRAGIMAPNIPSSNGTTTTWLIHPIFVKLHISEISDKTLSVNRV